MQLHIMNMAATEKRFLAAVCNLQYPPTVLLNRLSYIYPHYFYRNELAMQILIRLLTVSSLNKLYTIIRSTQLYVVHHYCFFNFRCLCNNCQTMPTLEESKCCQNTNVVDGKLEAENISCITEHDGFRANCLNIHVLEASYYDYVLQSGLPEENQRIHE